MEVVAWVGFMQGDRHCIVSLPCGHIVQVDVEGPLAPAINGSPVEVGQWASGAGSGLNIDVQYFWSYKFGSENEAQFLVDLFHCVDQEVEGLIHRWKLLRLFILDFLKKILDL